MSRKTDYRRVHGENPRAWKGPKTWCGRKLNGATRLRTAPVFDCEKCIKEKQIADVLDAPIVSPEFAALIAEARANGPYWGMNPQ